MNTNKALYPEDILEKPRICLYRHDINLRWRVGVLLRIRSGLNFIYLIHPNYSKTYGEYIGDAAAEFETQVERIRAFEPIQMDHIFKKVDPKDYGKEKLYYVYDQPDHWRIYNQDEVAPKREIRDEAHPFQGIDPEDIEDALQSLGYKTREEWWEKEERYTRLLACDKALWENDIPRPEGQEGYAVTPQKKIIVDFNTL
jgi:hypothetical protein